MFQTGLGVGAEAPAQAEPVPVGHAQVIYTLLQEGLGVQMLVAGGKEAIGLGQHAAEIVARIMLSLVFGAGGTVFLAAVMTQVVSIIQLPATGKLHNARSLLPVRGEEVIIGVAIIVATQSVHLASEALMQAHGQLGIPVVGDHQPEVQFHNDPCPTVVHEEATIAQGDRQPRALVVDLQRG